MKAQIYSHLTKTLGYITENANTSKYLKDNIFSKGATIEEYDLIRQLTGQNFSAEAYISTL
jgi:Zn-dependent M32 family carboxypeptidase